MTSTMEIELGDLPPGLGGARPVALPATRYTQGGRMQFHVTIPVWQLTQLIVNKPDPNRPLEGNRRVDGPRADRFGEYILTIKGWISPAIIVRAPKSEVGFTVAKAFEDGTAWGILEIPLDLLSEIVVLDGQHRTLGVFRALEKINRSIQNQRSLIDQMEDQGQPRQEIEKQKAKLQDDLRTRERLSKEHISIDIAEVRSNDAGQMFGDINNNAKGVNADLRTVLDQRDVVNRIALTLIDEHPLFVDRVERGERARFGSNNPNLLGAKGVADIVRAYFVGTGRVGRRIEDELSRAIAVSTDRVKDFLDLLIASFDDLDDLVNGVTTPIELRSRSMLGSVTMLRALAATYHELTTPSAGVRVLSRAEIEEYFRKLAASLSRVPVEESDAMWFGTGAFAVGAMAPSARSQDFKALVDALVNWARDGIPA
jgi:hypothetical protein